jgi:hypothetical protein
MGRHLMFMDQKNIVKMLTLLPVISRSSTISLKMPMTPFTELEKMILWKHERSQMSKASVNSKTKAGDIITLDFRAYYRAMVTQTA